MLEGNHSSKPIIDNKSQEHCKYLIDRNPASEDLQFKIMLDLNPSIRLSSLALTNSGLKILSVGHMQ